jgi:hypothetical protein
MYMISDEFPIWLNADQLKVTLRDYRNALLRDSRTPDCFRSRSGSWSPLRKVGGRSRAREKGVGVGRGDRAWKIMQGL